MGERVDDSDNISAMDSFDRTVVNPLATASQASAAQSSGASPRLYVIVFHEQKSFLFQLPFDGEVVIGRSDDADLRVLDSSVSRKHATISIKAGQAEILDLGSQNGVLINRTVLTGPRRLAANDTVQLGKVTLVFYSNVRAVAGERSVLTIQDFCERALEELERSHRFDRPCTIVALQCAAPKGERTSVATRVGELIRRIDLLAWNEEGQLLILMPETSKNAAGRTLGRVLGSLDDSLKAQAGYASFPTDGVDAEALCRLASTVALDATPGQVLGAAEDLRTLEIGPHTVTVVESAMQRIFDLLRQLAASELPVLVCGETGTGKELAAQAVHHWSKRKAGRLVSLNCAAIQENLVESELFGYEKGAFSGATSAKQGLLEAGNGGTVFLDEIGDMPLSVQAKLLRVLEARTIMRLGSLQERTVDIRIVAATNRDLDAEVKAGRFRRDLFFRLSAAMIWLPPLRDRAREIPILAQRFLREASTRLGQELAPTLTESATTTLLSHDWPGNIRELKNVMEYAVATITGTTIEGAALRERLLAAEAKVPVNASDRDRGPRDVVSAPMTPQPDEPPLPNEQEGQSITGTSISLEALDSPGKFRSLAEELRALERARMKEALDATSGNRTKAAALIGMPLRTFVAKLKTYRLASPMRGA